MAEQTIHPFLMFQERAEEAIRFYVSLFPNSKIDELETFAPDAPTAVRARFTVGGQTIHATESRIKHAFTFTPSFSLFVDCASEAEVARLSAALAEGGSVLMPVGNYGFSRQFSWVNDRFGVCWQLNCA